MQKKSNPPVWVSQNFLTSSKIIRRLINKTNIKPDDHVIEIGPGKGHITNVLLQYCNNISAIEIDKNLYNLLYAKYQSTIKLYHQDFLKWKLPTSKPYKVFANIPFNHTTDIIRKLTKSNNPPTDAWLIMEKGAAKRFIGIPHETKISLMIKPQFEMRIIYHFTRDDFHPKPNADIVMLHIRRKATDDIPKHQLRQYQHFISSAFSKDGIQLFTRKQ